MFVINFSFQNLKFECYHATIYKRFFLLFQHLSQINETIRYISNLEIDNNTKNINQISILMLYHHKGLVGNPMVVRPGIRIALSSSQL